MIVPADQPVWHQQQQQQQPPSKSLQSLCFHPDVHSELYQVIIDEVIY